MLLAYVTGEIKGDHLPQLHEFTTGMADAERRATLRQVDLLQALVQTTYIEKTYKLPRTMVAE